MERLLCFLAALFLLAGCATLRDVPRDDRSRTFATAPDRLIDSTADVLQAEGYRVRRMPASAPGTDAEVLIMGYRWDTYEQRRWLEVTVRPMGDSACVVVRLWAERHASADGRQWDPVTLNREHMKQTYARYLDLIADRL